MSMLMINDMEWPRIRRSRAPPPRVDGSIRHEGKTLHPCPGMSSDEVGIVRSVGPGGTMVGRAWACGAVAILTERNR
jgi:hypothetical protein